MRWSLGVLLLLASCAISASARADDTVRLERIDWQRSSIARHYLTLVDRDGQVISGKTAGDFRLSVDSIDQGVAREATTFDQTGETIHVVVVAQTSGAMQPVMEQLKAGVRAISDGMDVKTRSKIGLVTFAAEPKKVAELGAPTDVEDAAGTLTVDESVEVHMLDAVRAAIDMLAKDAGPGPTRKLIVLFSDGSDVNLERRAFTAIGKRAFESGVVIDTVGYSPREPGRLTNLAELAARSNGIDRQARDAADVRLQLSSVVDEIKKQYVLTFEMPRPEAATETAHAIQVVYGAGNERVLSNVRNERLWDPDPPPPPPRRWTWWSWLGGILLACGLLVIALRKSA